MDQHARTSSYWERDYTGAAFLGWFRWFGTSATFPFGSLHVSQHAVTVRIGLGSWTWHSATLRREEVKQVVLERRLWTRFARFVHGKRGCPEFVLFATLPLEPLLQELRAMGYPVA
jgi:hypothetical protein